MTMKSLFNFYLDDDDKLAITEKLERISGKKEKGQLASFLRIQVKLFLATPDDKVNRTLINAIDAEYTTTVKSNKRSKL